MSRKLAFLESIMGEEYYMFVQMKTLEIMVKEINQTLPSLTWKASRACLRTSSTTKNIIGKLLEPYSAPLDLSKSRAVAHS